MRRLVAVKWLDAGSGDDEEEANGHMRYSAGFEVKRVLDGHEDGRGIWIAMEEDAGSSVHYIPEGMIRTVIPLAPVIPLDDLS